MPFLKYNPKLKLRARELRKNMTEPEKRIRYKVLKDCGKNVLRQKPISGFIVDFYIPSLKLVIEIDGDSHFDEQGKAYDSERTAVLEGLGLQVLRFTNLDVMENIEGVYEEVMKKFSR